MLIAFVVGIVSVGMSIFSVYTIIRTLIDGADGLEDGCVMTLAAIFLAMFGPFAWVSVRNLYGVLFGV